MKHHFPKRVEMHNYSPQNAVHRRLNNWHTLNRKVLSKLGMGLSNATMEDLANAKAGTIESVLHDIKNKIDKQENKDDGDKGDVLVMEGMSASSTGSAVAACFVAIFVTVDLRFFSHSSESKNW